MTRHGQVRALPILIVIAAIATVVIWWANSPTGGDNKNAVGPASQSGGGESNGKKPPEATVEAWTEDRQRALELQRDGQWCEAAEAWDAVLKKLPAKSAAPDRDEAQENKRLADARCRPEKPPVAELQVEPPAADRKPAKPSESDVLKFYSPGRKVRSVAWFNVTGTGSNSKWLVRSNANFLYQYRIALETTVKQNDGATVVFEQEFAAVDEVMAISDQKFELQFPQSPVLDVLWSEIDRQLRLVPIYRVIKLVAKSYNTLDPNAERLLTRLGRFVPGIEKAHQIELAERVKDLTGHKLEITYIAGLGVSFVKTLTPEDAALDPDTLNQIARGSSLFADYYISQVDSAEEGEIVPVRAEDVGALFSIGDQFSASGQIELKKVGPPGGAAEAHLLKVAGGSLEIEASDDGVTRRATLTPKAGAVDYAPAERLVRRAMLEWHTDTLWATRDHLLFGTTSTRNLDITSYYEAELVSHVEAGGEGAK